MQKLKKCIDINSLGYCLSSQTELSFFPLLIILAIEVEMRIASPNQEACPLRSKALMMVSCLRPVTRPAPETTNSYLRCLVKELLLVNIKDYLLQLVFVPKLYIPMYLPNLLNALNARFVIWVTLRGLFNEDLGLQVENSSNFYLKSFIV